MQQALKQSKALENKKLAEIKYNQRLLISNFPLEHSEKLIFDLCNCFAKVSKVELLNDKDTGAFNGQANVDFESEIE